MRLAPDRLLNARVDYASFARIYRKRLVLRPAAVSASDLQGDCWLISREILKRKSSRFHNAAQHGACDAWPVARADGLLRSSTTEEIEVRKGSRGSPRRWSQGDTRL
jgi:hypothetical protein